MKFGSCPVEAAQGAILAHAVRAGEQRFKKGRRLSAGDIEALVAADVRDVVVARHEADDIGEDEAAARIASALAGPGVRIGAAFTGRANLYAVEPGIAA